MESISIIFHIAATIVQVKLYLYQTNIPVTSKNSLCIIDSGFANLYSMQNAFAHLGYNAPLLSRPEQLKDFKAAVFPGVGAFHKVKEKLDSNGFTESIRHFVKEGGYFLGVCLGMQMLFDESEEGGLSTNGLSTNGLNFIEGKVLALPKDKIMRVPHIGWNALYLKDRSKHDPLLESLADLSYVYFVHSYYCQPENQENCLASVKIDQFSAPAIVLGGERIYGMQFHPERSGQVGLRLLDRFLHITQS